MRKNWFLLVIGSFLFGTAFSQEDETNLRICRGETYFVWYINGCSFKAFNEVSTQHPSVVCDNYAGEYFLNGLRLNQKQFYNLELSPEYFSNDSTTFFHRRGRNIGSGTFEYRYEKQDTCVDKIVFRAEVKCTIILNGLEINRAEQETMFSKISSAEIESIVIARTLFGKGKIYMITKEN